MALFPPERRPTVDVVALGDVPSRAVATARTTVEETVGTVAGTRRGPPPAEVAEPTPAEFAADDQYDAGSLLEAVADASEADLAVGLTDVPVRHRDLTSLFGLGYVGGDVAVVSTYRFDEGEDERFDERVAKQVRKQLGRLFGLESTHEGCVLEEAPFLHRLDESAADFCTDCRERLVDPETAPRPPEWIVRDSPTVADADADGNGGASDDDLDLSLRTLPLLAVGVAVLPLVALARGVARLSAWESTLPAGVRRLIHGSYRYLRFWTAVALFFLFALLAVLAELSLYERLAGSEPGVRLFWGMLVVALGSGYLGQRWARGLVVGAYRVFAYEP
ncbi:hypothetical protein [Salinilacihabitans rarus]|uniref:hypothetical protein n=1 Tax=Salinilacihabitans rarus TaxID=2961596 RepID=UPI0020C860E6|nr:hypothetical protein [Salinilacihabitans rarus]